MFDPLNFEIPTETQPTIPSRPALPTRKLLTPSPSNPSDYILEIDNSSLEQFTLCHRKAEYGLVLARQAARSESALEFGHLFHKCEELRLRYGLSADTLAAQEKLIAAYDLAHPPGPDDHRTGARMRSVLQKYNSLYAADHWPENVVLRPDGEKMVEQAFKIELCTIPVNDVIPFPWHQLTDTQPIDSQAHFLPVSSIHCIWTGRIDAVIREGPYTFVVDHKTSSTGGREFEEAFRLAAQMLGYTFAARRILGVPIQGVIVNQALIRPEAKTGRATQPREEFHRLPYFYDPARVAEWEESTKHILADFISCLLRGFFPLTGPRSFRSPCVWCDYHDVCQLPPAQRPGLLSSNLFRDVTWNPITE